MTDWQIDIPYRSRDDLVLDTITAARQEFGADDHRTQLVEVIARDALHNRSITSVGALLDDLAALDQAAVRARLDQARGELGLPSTGEADKRRDDSRFEAGFQRLQPPPPPKWSPIQSCPAEGCNAYPTEPSGALREVTVNRWHCPRHEHLAGPDDLAEYEPPFIGLSSTGRPIPSEKERKRIEAWHREREEEERRERERREAHLARESEALAAVRRRYQENETISVMGRKVKPKDVHFS